MSTHTWDQITVEDLRRNGGRKWSEFPDKIGAFVAEMDFGTSPEVAAAIQDAVTRHHFGYAPSKAHAELADALAGWVGREFDWQVDPSAVVSVGDVLSAFAAVIEKFTAPGSTVVLPAPAYMPFLLIPPALGRRVEQVPMLQAADGAWSYDFDRIEELFAAGPSLFVLCNPHNPIGKVASREELETIAHLATQHGGLVFSSIRIAGMYRLSDRKPRNTNIFAFGIGGSTTIGACPSVSPSAVTIFAIISIPPGESGRSWMKTSEGAAADLDATPADLDLNTADCCPEATDCAPETTDCDPKTAKEESEI